MNYLSIFTYLFIKLVFAFRCNGQEVSYTKSHQTEEEIYLQEVVDYKYEVIKMLREELDEREILESYMLLGIVDSSYLSIIPSINPIEIYQQPYITSLYGVRLHPIKKTYIKHQGIDLACTKGFQLIYATASGVITKSGYNGGLGLSVTIEHPSGFETVYGHLSGIFVNDNEVVKIGNIIGVMGETGLAKGVHLHYAVKRNGVAINPLPYLTLYQEFTEKRDALKASLLEYDAASN